MASVSRNKQKILAALPLLFVAAAIPTLAAPAFAAALYGDRVHTLVTAAGRTLVVIEIVVDTAEGTVVTAWRRAAP